MSVPQSVSSRAHKSDRLLTHATLAGLDISLQEPVDHVVEFHETLVLAQIILGFAKSVVDLSIRASDTDLARLLKRVQDLGIIQDS